MFCAFFCTKISSTKISRLSKSGTDAPYHRYFLTNFWFILISGLFGLVVGVWV